MDWEYSFTKCYLMISLLMIQVFSTTICVTLLVFWWVKMFQKVDKNMKFVGKKHKRNTANIKCLQIRKKIFYMELIVWSNIIFY